MEAMSNRDLRANLQHVPDFLSDSLDNHSQLITVQHFRPNHKDNQQIINGAIGAEPASQLGNYLSTKIGLCSYASQMAGAANTQSETGMSSLTEYAGSYQEYAIKYLVRGKRYVIVGNIARSSVLVIAATMNMPPATMFCSGSINPGALVHGRDVLISISKHHPTYKRNYSFQNGVVRSSPKTPYCSVCKRAQHFVSVHPQAPFLVTVTFCPSCQTTNTIRDLTFRVQRKRQLLYCSQAEQPESPKGFRAGQNTSLCPHRTQPVSTGAQIKLTSSKPLGPKSFFQILTSDKGPRN